MNSSLFTKISVGSVAALGLCLSAGIAAPAQAGTLIGDWEYSIDSFSDASGGSPYDIKGLAYRETNDSVLFAISGNTPWQSEHDDGHEKITYGDLFLNFTGNSFKAASDAGQLIGIKFAPNDVVSRASGVYNNVKAGRIDQVAGASSDQAVYTSLDWYYDAGFNKTNTMGTDFSTKTAALTEMYGEAVANSPTRTNTKMLNVIASGDRLGDFTTYDQSSLTGLGLNFAAAGNQMVGASAQGSYVFGVSLSKALLESVMPSGDYSFVASVLLECANDAVGLSGSVALGLDDPNSADVPEPSTVLGMAGLFLMGLFKRRREQGDSSVA
jgi:hypothetical protein